MSSLLFDGDENSLSLFDNSGKLLGSWQASNRGVHAAPSEQWIRHIPDGAYEFEADSRHAPQKHSDTTLDTLNGPYGTLGILVLKRVAINGRLHEGLGIHAGRQSDGGPFHVTHGCIRTTELAMRTISASISRDPLKVLTVRNNGKGH